MSKQHRPQGPWWRSRPLIAVVVCVDLLGAGLVIYAVTRPSSRRRVATSAVVVAQLTARPTATPAARVPAIASPTRRRLPAATSMPSPSDSRAPTLSVGANTQPRIQAVPALKASAQASFARLTSRLGSGARISLAIQPLGSGRMQVLGGDPPVKAMSTSKILILSALLRDKGGLHHLTAGQTSLARAAITLSDNSAILGLFSALEADKGGLLGASTYATELLRQAGDERTQVATTPPPPGYATTFGQTPWTPTAEVDFFRALALGCVLSKPDAAFELGLMRNIVPSESFGLGSAGFQQVAFKGGWGPEPGGQYGVRQTGIIGSGSSGIVVALTADPVSTFAAGQSVLDQVAQWLHSQVQLTRRAAGSCAA